MCDKKVYTPPECTVSEGRVRVGTKTRVKKPGATRGVCDKEKGFMCAPVGWRD